MLDEYACFDKGGLVVEVNWNEFVKPCKKIRFKIGDKEAIIDNGDFYGMMMFFGTSEQQEQLIPIKETKVRMVTTLLKVRAKKDIMKGEMIVFPHTYPVASSIYEKIKLEGSGIEKLDKDILKIGAIKKERPFKNEVLHTS